MHVSTRLNFYENNAAAGTFNEGEKTMSMPAMSAYKDLNSGINQSINMFISY